MRTIEIEYPETIPAVLNLSPETFEQEARSALAVKLYENGSAYIWTGCTASKSVTCGIFARLSAIWRSQCGVGSDRD